MEQSNCHGHGLPHQLQNMHHQQNQNHLHQVHQMQMQRPQQLQLPQQEQQPPQQHPMQAMQSMQPLQQQKPPSAQPAHSGFAPRRQYDTSASLTNGNAEAASSTGTQRPSKAKKDKPTTGQPPQLQTQTQPQPQQQSQLQLSEVDAISSTDKAISFVSETDANGLAMKTPVSILQEILSRRGITPGYELVQIEGAIHEPTFRFRVSFKDKETPFTAMGAGRSKKEAKHAAARALIDKLMGAQLPDSSVANSSVATSVADPTAAGSGGDCNAAAVGDISDKIVGNPIGLLQELCMQRRWPPPSYSTVTEMGLPHERLFTIACTILQHREIGKGKSKKIAKRLAAHKMWSRLQDTPIDAAKIPDVGNELEGDSRINDNDNYYGDLKDITVPTLTTQHSNKVSQFHKTLKNATGKKLLKLQKTCLRSATVDHPKLLGDIAVENQFEVTYVDIEEKTFSDQFQCLVQLSTLPVGVCHGTGLTSTKAQRDAAKNALEYLKIMTKK